MLIFTEYIYTNEDTYVKCIWIAQNTIIIFTGKFLTAHIYLDIRWTRHISRHTIKSNDYNCSINCD